MKLGVADALDIKRWLKPPSDSTALARLVLETSSITVIAGTEADDARQWFMKIAALRLSHVFLYGESPLNVEGFPV